MLRWKRNRLPLLKSGRPRPVLPVLHRQPHLPLWCPCLLVVLHFAMAALSPARRATPPSLWVMTLGGLIARQIFGSTTRHTSSPITRTTSTAFLLKWSSLCPTVRLRHTRTAKRCLSCRRHSKLRPRTSMALHSIRQFHLV